MYKSKKDVDKHVEKLLSKLSVKEFKTRAYSVARLYFDAGDYASCQKYVEQYLTQKDNNAAAYKLLGQAFQKMGQKDKALEQFKTSLVIDQTQTGTILDICELLADEDVSIDSGRANYWFEKAESIFPKHPVTFRLRERLMTLSDPDPEAFIDLLTLEINARPKDPLLHARLLKHYLKMNKFAEAFEHSCKIEFGSLNFTNNCTWYEILDELLEHNLEKTDKCLYQLLLLTVKERLTVLSLTETPIGTSKSLVESAKLLHDYDQALESVAKAGAAPGFAEFHASLLQHHRGQFSFHAATLLLKRAKKEISRWSDSTKAAAPLMLLAWQTVPLDTKVNWLKNAPEKLQNAVNRWYSEGTYRCSQSGHYLVTNYQDKNQTLQEQISHCCSGSHWKEKMYEKIFTAQGSKIQTSHFSSNDITAPQLRLPRKSEVEAYDSDAQKEYGNSLHHFVWTLLNYKNFAHFKCTLFDMLKPTVTSSGPETLNKLDIYAFLYCAALTTRQQKSNEVLFVCGEKPKVLPANITDLLCTLSQMKWWDCAYKFSQNILGTELTDIRATLSRGIEVVRCIDDYSLDPELLCILGRIFSEHANFTTSVEEKNHIETTAGLYYGCAIPLLEKLKNKMMIRVSDKRLFDYTHKDIGPKELHGLLEESKLFVAILHIKENEYEKAIELLISIKSQNSYYHLAQAFKKLAEDESHSFTEGSKSKYALFLSKAKTYAYKALDFKEHETNKSLTLYSDIQELIEDIEICMNKMDDSKDSIDKEGKYSSDEDRLYHNEHRRTNRNVYRNISSTPKAKHNNTNYQTAVDSQILETSRLDQKHLERIGNEIKNLQKRDETITDFMEQTKTWFEENRNLGNKIINTINTNIQNTTDQFKQLKISVDQVKGQIDECRNECKDVGEIKKQISELKKEVDKLKKVPSEQTLNESDLYNLDEEYRASENTPAYGTQLPFTPQMLPPFNQRFPIPPNPYQLYHQNLFNLYNQYSHTGHSSSVPAAQSLFDPTRSQMNFPGVYPTPDHNMFLDMAHLLPPIIQLPNTIPNAPIVPPVPITSVPPMTTPISTTTSSSLTSTAETKDISRRLPVNVVVTSSDPLPTPTSAPASVVRVTVPPKHINSNQPHNYQIELPATTKTQVSEPPVFTFTMPENKNSVATSLSNWNKAFQTFPTDNSSLYDEAGDTLLNASNSVVGGPFAGANNSFNKSRTLSEKSNTSVENYDPCPDFKPIVPLPAEVKVTTGEEDEEAIFSSRAKLFRFVNKQWKERGIGEMKLLKHKRTGKVRVLMRREQVHKICANHIITPEMEINPMKKETKAYIWVANDFAEESVVLEKFCVRFKTADIANQFYETFVKARLESAVFSSNTESQQKQTVIKTNSNIVSTDKTQLGGKTTVGGFTFSGTPLFKPVQNDNSKDIKISDAEANKTNIFSNLSFKTGAATAPLSSNMFKVTSALTANITIKETTEDSNKNKLNSSDTVEDFEPNVEFKPVIALPALVEQVTGEEDETILFEHRAKLLRYDSSTKEWKERGLGNIKLLARKDNNQKIRLLMRREQIMKVCCNHVLTKQMTFQKMPNMDKAVTWCAKDFSEGELIAETFCLRFKTVQACDNFMQSVKAVQEFIKDDSETSKEKETVSKETNSSGFGDKFKAKAGSWYCQGCYTNNLVNFEKCACCEQPKPKVAGDVDTLQHKEAEKISNWGDKFKPKPGSWECKACLIRNEANHESCSACNSPKDPTSKPSSTITANIKTNFSFGIPQQTAFTISLNQSKTEPSVKTIAPAVSGFGDKFKPKEGSWECKQCAVRNTPTSENCCACSSPKDPNAPKKNSVFDTTAAPTVKFSFGIPSTDKNVEKPKSEPLFEGTGANKFSFGVPSTISGINMQKPPALTQEAPKWSANTNSPLNFSLKTSVESKPTVPAEKPKTVTAGKETGFGFVFKTSAPKSTITTPQEKADESHSEELVKEEDCTAQFTPVVPLPDKVEVVTGEENEVELYGYRAKLYIYISGEWKERGTGIVKILKHKETSKLRVVMRREQVLKICLNHALTSDLKYTPKDKKSWLFAANDFSEGELALQKFCLRFSNEEIALQFKEALDNALNGKPSKPKEESKTKKPDNKNEHDDDVVFVNETQANAEDKQKAKDLMLPENFYMYKNKERCDGCRGCSDESDNEAPKTVTVAAVAAALAKQNETQLSFATPLKNKLLTTAFQTPTTSVYGTPGGDKTIDNSIFRTPLGSFDFSTVTSTPTNANDDTIDANNKENVFALKCNFSNFGEQKNVFGKPPTSQGSIFGTGGSQTSLSGSSSTSLLAAPKLSALNIFGENKTTDPKSIFSSAQAKPVFGESNNIPIFGFAAEKPKDEKPTEVRSLFGSNEASVNLFSGPSQGSFFGPGALNNNLPKSGAPFGFESLLGSAPLGNSANEASKFSTIWAPVSADQKTEVAELPLKLENNLSFAALSTSGPSTFEKKADFKWEGTGQQLFTSGQKKDSKNVSGAGDESGNAEEEFDPHYEPIVPLPDKIVVTTGEEDEKKLFGERGKIYRYDDKNKEWKERGVGELKILHHPQNNTYRLLLRREQIHKAVLNMLLHADIELLPMKNTETAWTFAGRNFAENPAGDHEMLAVRFKNTDLANSFRDQVNQCTRMLQAAAAKAIREEKEGKDTKETPVTAQEETKESKVFTGIAPLRLPKHLQDNSRADNVFTVAAQQAGSVQPTSAEAFWATACQQAESTFKTAAKPNGDGDDSSAGDGKQVHFEEEEVDDYEDDDDDENYDDQGDIYYYEGGYVPSYICDGEAIVVQGEEQTSCPHATIQLLLESTYSPKIRVTDADTGEILADILINTDTELQMIGDSCKWTGTDYTSNEPVDKTVTINFFESESAVQFYDNVEIYKQASFTSNDLE